MTFCTSVVVRKVFEFAHDPEQPDTLSGDTADVVAGVVTGLPEPHAAMTTAVAIAKQIRARVKVPRDNSLSVICVLLLPCNRTRASVHRAINGTT
jgi:hypothetical protein